MSTDLYQAGVEAKLPARALKAMRATHSHVVLLTKGKPTVVVQDFAAFQEQRQSLLMLKLMVQAERSIAAGRTSPTKAVVASRFHRPFANVTSPPVPQSLKDAAPPT